MLIDKVNHHIQHPLLKENRVRKGYYPSEASAIDKRTGKCLGKCLRAAYYSWSGEEKTNPPDARGEWTFAFGHGIEAMYTEYFKQLGIWAGNNVKFYDVVRNISGESDIFVFDDNNEVQGVEIKTAYGYGFQKNVKTAPKPENLMQVGIYLDNFLFTKYYILIYHARDTHEQVEYKVSRHEIDGKHHLMINDVIPVTNWSMEDVYERYNLLGQALMTKIMPPNDFTYCYTKEESAQRFANGEISKTKWAKVEKDTEFDSDWQCLYCPYLDKCWAKKRGEMKLKFGGIK